MIQNLGKGALEDKPDARDLKLSFLAGAPAPIDWSKEFRLPEPPDTNQENADCCVGEASSNFHWQLKGKKFSVKSLFAYIAQAYGAYLRDGPARIVGYGQETIQETADPAHKTAQNMRDKSGLNPADALDDRELAYFETDAKNIDAVAQAIRDWKGVIIGIQGSNAGFVDLTNPRPPIYGESTWGHAIYGFGYHMHDGLKCIIFKSSWCGAVASHHEHHIKENYFASGNTYSAWVLVPKENIPMTRRFKVNDHGTLGVMVITEGSLDAVFHRAKSEEHYQHLLKDCEVPADAPTISIP